MELGYGDWAHMWWTGGIHLPRWLVRLQRRLSTGPSTTVEESHQSGYCADSFHAIGRHIHGIILAANLVPRSKRRIASLEWNHDIANGYIPACRFFVVWSSGSEDGILPPRNCRRECVSRRRCGFDVHYAARHKGGAVDRIPDTNRSWARICNATGMSLFRFAWWEV